MTTPTQSTQTTSAGRARALILATAGFALNFWAWSLLSPLGPVYVEQGLAAEASFIVAVPVLVGSLGRILIGALTDRFGGRTMMSTVSVITMIPVLFIGLIGQYTYPTLILGGFFLGIAGTTFAIGVPYVNSWFPPKSRGTAIGIYGAGMGGTAIAAFTTVPLFEQNDRLPFLVTAVVLAVYAVVAYLLMVDSPRWSPQRKNLGAQLAATATIALTWQTCYLYAVSFGGYVAFSVYLPTLLSNEHELAMADASARMAGFVIAAVIARALGGVLSDRIGPVRALILSNSMVVVAALVAAAGPELVALGTISYLTMAVGMGLGAAATFGLIAQTADQSMVGSITGFVGAAGGLGGFVPPLVLGALWNLTGSYTVGILLLAGATVIAVLITIRVGAAAKRTATQEAAEHTTTADDAPTRPEQT